MSYPIGYAKIKKPVMNPQSTPQNLPPKTPDFVPELLRFRPRRRRRTDKIARLPTTVRDCINHMLDEGLPYRDIIQRLGEHGKNLSKQNLSRWKQGAYQDYLNDQQLAEHNRLQMEFAAQLLPEMPADCLQIKEACNCLAALQTFKALQEQGSALLNAALKADPFAILHLSETICRQTNAFIALERARSSSSHA